MPKKLKIFVHALSATGHLNSAIGIAQSLQNRGHEIIFIINTELTEQLEKYGFRVLPLTIKVSVELSSNPAKDFGDMMKANGFFTNKSSYEKTKMLAENSETATFRTMKNHMIEFDGQIEHYLEQEKPDLFIYDQFYYFPCLAKHPIPWMKIMSCQPSCFIPESCGLAPSLSGYSLGERDKFPAFHEMLKNSLVASTIDCQNELNHARNFTPTGSEYVAGFGFWIMSPFLNIYQYPEELDYPEIAKNPLPIFGIDAFIRDEKAHEFKLDKSFLPTKPEEKLIFLSMGSMGGVDLDMMRRLIKVLSKSPHKFVVSKGPLGDELELPANMWGENSVAQTKILPICDLVITHGGNNTVCESFRFGKPMIVLPIFGDQMDNGQRVKETGFGLRFEPFDLKDNELLDGIEKLLNDSELKIRLENAKRRMDTVDKKVQLCVEIEKIVGNYKSK